MLRDVLFKRNPMVNPSHTTRVLNTNFYDNLPVESVQAAEPYGSRDQNMFVRLRRGKVQPPNLPRFLDFDRTDRITTQEHGMKVRLGDKTVDDLMGEKDANGNVVRTTLGQIRRSIEGASADQLGALANAVGIPITNDIVKLRKTLENSMLEFYNLGITPSLEQQRDILDALQNIQKSSQPTTSSTQPTTSSSTQPTTSSTQPTFQTPQKPPQKPPKGFAKIIADRLIKSELSDFADSKNLTYKTHDSKEKIVKSIYEQLSEDDRKKLIAGQLP
jgi:hypothetical protein